MKLIKRLYNNEETSLVQSLSAAVTARERKKGQLHKVFKSSFDAKPIFSDKFLIQKIDYIHHNPVCGKWNLAKDYVSYEYSSASFNELGISQHFIPMHYKDLYRGIQRIKQALFIGVSQKQYFSAAVG